MMDYTPLPGHTRPYTERVVGDDGGVTLVRYGHAAPFRAPFDAETDASDLTKEAYALLAEWQAKKGETHTVLERLYAISLENDKAMHGHRCALDEVMQEIEAELGPLDIDPDWPANEVIWANELEDHKDWRL